MRQYPFWIYILIFIASQIIGAMFPFAAHLLWPDAHINALDWTSEILFFVNLLAIVLCLLTRPANCDPTTLVSSMRVPRLWHTLLMVLIAPPVILLVNWVQEQLPPLPDLIPEQSIGALLTSPLGLITVCIIGPLSEELLFRGGMLGSLLRSQSAWKAIAWSSFAFALIHANPVQMPAAFCLGILLGWAYVRTKSLMAPLLIHIFNNSLAVTFPDSSINDILLMPWHHVAFVVISIAWIVIVGRTIRNIPIQA